MLLSSSQLSGRLCQTREETGNSGCSSVRCVTLCPVKDLSLNTTALHRQSPDCLYVAQQCSATSPFSGAGPETQQPCPGSCSCFP